MAGIEELRVAIRLIMDKKEVPEAIKKAAFEEIDVVKMSVEDGEPARLYVLDELHKAIEDESVERLESIGSVLEVMDGFMPSVIEDKDDDFVSDETMKLVRKAVDDFVRCEFADKGRPEGAAIAVLERLSKSNDFIPLKYNEGFLIGFSQDAACIVIYSVNNELSLDEFHKMSDKFDHREIAKTIIEQWDVGGSINIKLCNLVFDEPTDGMFQLKAYPAK